LADDDQCAMTFIEKVALQVRSANQKGKKEGQVGELGLRDFLFFIAALSFVSFALVCV
jgi:hypothetical protein